MIDDTGTEGQVGRYDCAGRDRGRARARRGERTRGRATRLGRAGLATGRARRTASAAAYLPASKAGDLKKVRNLQKLMLRSRANAMLSVRRVTELNAGRLTAGVDGKVVRSSRSKSMWVDWAQSHCRSWTVKPVRRVYVPKANGKRRPIGIPVIGDRILQALTSAALEPEWL